MKSILSYVASVCHFIINTLKQPLNDLSYLCSKFKEPTKQQERFMEAQWKKGGEPIFYIFLPTLWVASFLKWKHEEEKKIIKRIISNLNSLYFAFTLFILVVLLVCDIVFKYKIPLECITNILFFFLFYYSFSRIFEILLAFSRDVYAQLSPTRSNSNLKYYERIHLAVTSYLELIILYAFIYYILNTYGFFNWKLEGLHSDYSQVWESLYFSGATITTLGYGDIKPIGFAPQFFSLMEVLNGFGLIIVSFTVYVSRSIEEEEYKKND